MPRRVELYSSVQLLTAAITVLAFAAPSLGAQRPASQSDGRNKPETSSADLVTRLRAALPPDVANHVLTTITRAQSDGLPGDALALRALKFSAKGVNAADIQRATDEQAERMRESNASINRGRSRRATGDEIEAGAEAIRRGVSGKDLSALAKQAPSGRSLTVPLFAIAGLIDRGLPSDDALERVRDQLEAQAADSDIAKLPQQVSNANARAERGVGHGGENDGRGQGHGNGVTGKGGNGPPAGVPANNGKKGKTPAPGKRP